jgi:hypothetical protein
LRAIVLRVVDRRDAMEFRADCRLARKVDAHLLRKALLMRSGNANPAVARRAGWVLAALQP